MSVSRYSRTPILGLGRRYGTSRAIEAVRRGIANGTIRFEEDFIRGRERLDTIAGRRYGDDGYWWAIAAASGIGWAPQAPPGTYIRIPELEDVLALVG